MIDNEFDEIMEAWADHETGAAPEMRPAADMVRLVQARRKKRPASPFSSRWATAGIALAGLMVLAVLYVILVQPPFPFERPPDQQLAAVGLRQATVPEKGVIVKGTVLPPDKGRGKGPPASFERLEFQFHKEGAQFVEARDLRAPQEGTIALTSADNYRLLLDPAAERHVTIFQWTTAGVLLKLFPNEAYSPAQNPLQEGQTYYLPSEPNWLYLEGQSGEERLYVVASAQARPDLEDLYAQYSQAEDEASRQSILSTLLDKLKAIAGAEAQETEGWVFIFQHR
jgi:hypothetical protein